MTLGVFVRLIMNVPLCLKVGNVAEYLVDASVATAKLRPNENMADIQASFQALLVAMLTGRPQPLLMNDFSHLLLRDEHFATTQKVFTNFQEDLETLAQAIDARNRVRPYTTEAFQPRLLLSSISI